MSTWKGKSRGNVLGYKVFVFLLSRLGLRFSYLILRFVAFYFVFAAFTASRHSYRFFRQRLSYSIGKSLLAVYKNHYKFGQVILDKVAMLSGLTNKFTYEFEGKHHLKQMAKEGKGGILISAHVGNWEIASEMLHEINTKVNVVMMDAEYQQIKNYLSSLTGERRYNIIAVKEDKSHIFEISNALINKEFICMHGDRFMMGSKVIASTLLGDEAYFPAGPFSIAKRLKVPATYVYAMKESPTHYHLYATEPFVHNGSLQDFVLSYAQSLEEKVRRYPYQWFNYYDFWNKTVADIKVET